jgi:hypothetical protein
VLSLGSRAVFSKGKFIFCLKAETGREERQLNAAEKALGRDKPGSKPLTPNLAAK